MYMIRRYVLNEDGILWMLKAETLSQLILDDNTISRCFSRVREAIQNHDVLDGLVLPQLPFKIIISIIAIEIYAASGRLFGSTKSPAGKGSHQVSKIHVKLL
jgi:hypothetical protein